MSQEPLAPLYTVREGARILFGGLVYTVSITRNGSVLCVPETGEVKGEFWLPKESRVAFAPDLPKKDESTLAPPEPYNPVKAAANAAEHTIISLAPTEPGASS